MYTAHTCIASQGLETAVVAGSLNSGLLCKLKVFVLTRNKSVGVIGVAFCCNFQSTYEA